MANHRKKKKRKKQVESAPKKPRKWLRSQGKRPALLFFCLSTVLISATYLFHGVSDEVHQLKAYRDLAKQLELADKNPKSFLSVETVEYLTPGLLPTTDGIIDEGHLVLITELFQVLKELSGDNYDNGVVRYLSLQQKEVLDYGAAKGIDTPLKTHLAPMEREFSDLHTTLIEHNKAAQLLSERSTLMNARLDEEYALANQITVSLSDLLSLSTVDITPTGEPEDYFYSRGILKGLPKLTGVPDNLEDFQAFKTALELRHGKIILNGSDAHQKFRDKLTTLKDNSADFVGAVREIRVKLNRLQGREKELNIRMESQVGALRLKIHQLLLTLLKPEVSSLGEMASEHLG